MTYGIGSGYLVPPLRQEALGFGMRTELATILGPTSRIAGFVRSGGPITGANANPALNSLHVSTLNAALSRCESGVGDIVLVAHDHAENVASADQMSGLVAGTRILGIGHGGARPTLTWTAAGATFLLDVANVELSGFILEMAGAAAAGALSVGAPITISAAGCTIGNCRIRTSWDADSLATIPITTTDAADDLTLYGLHMYGATAGESTTFLQMLGVDRLKMWGCHLEGATSSTTVGVMRFAATAATQIDVRGCTFINRKAASVHAVTGVAALSGSFSDCDFGILDDATLAGLVTTGDLMKFRCKTVNLAGESGGETSTVSA